MRPKRLRCVLCSLDQCCAALAQAAVCVLDRGQVRGRTEAGKGAGVLCLAAAASVAYLQSLCAWPAAQRCLPAIPSPGLASRPAWVRHPVPSCAGRGPRCRVRSVRASVRAVLGVRYRSCLLAHPAQQWTNLRCDAVSSCDEALRGTRSLPRPSAPFRQPAPDCLQSLGYGEPAPHRAHARSGSAAQSRSRFADASCKLSCSLSDHHGGV